MVAIDVIKDINEASRTVVFAFSRFGVVDSDGDVVQAGAFAKSITERGPQGSDRIKHVFNHNKTSIPPIGKVLRMWEDGEYAYAESRLVNNQMANDVWDGYLKGTLTEHSYWGKGVNSQKTGTGYIHKEIKLFEVSTVLWGANEDAKLKSLVKGGLVDAPELITRFEDLQKWVKKSEASDDFIADLECELNKMEALIKALRPQEAPKPQVNASDLINLYKLI